MKNTRNQNKKTFAAKNELIEVQKGTAKITLMKTHPHLTAEDLKKYPRPLHNLNDRIQA